MVRFGSFIVVLCIIAVSLCPSIEAAERSVAIGDQIEDLSFKDLRYLPRSLDDFENKKAYVLVFTNTTCPLVQRYLPRLQEMSQRYADQGVQFLAVNVGPDDSIIDVASHSIDFGVLFPFVKDVDGSCVAALGVERTPEAVVLDSEKRLVYRGRIDDQYRLGGVRPDVRRHDLDEAISELLSGETISVPETKVDGCKITPPKAPEVNEEVTFSKQISRLMQDHCQECHRENTAAPFTLTTYDDVASNAEMIAEVVSEGRMPPWFASPKYGHFINDRSLSREERDQIVAWVRAGTPEGDPADMPEPLEFPKTQWRIGEPDLVLTMSKEIDVQADGYVPYEYVVLPHFFLKDTWIEAFEILPHNPAVVHHCNAAYASGKDGAGADTFITGYVPGGQPLIASNFNNGVAFKIPRLSVIGLQIHVVTTGKPEKCKISVGIRFPRYTVEKQLHHVILDDRKFKIAPGHPAYMVSDDDVLDHDVTMLGMFSHMHLRGKDMTFLAHLPDGATQTLLQIPNFNFDWQLGYEIEPGALRLPKGTRLEAIAHYDNSAFNPYNPNPDRVVPYGDQTYDEMINGFAFFTHDDEELSIEVNPKNGYEVTDRKK